MATRRSVAPFFARPADVTAYASGDLVANSTTAGSVTAMAFPLMGLRSPKIVGAQIRKNTATATAATFRLHLFSAAPTVSAGDNAAIAVSSSLANYFGYIDLDMTTAGSVIAAATLALRVGFTVPLGLGEGLTTIYGLMEARAAYAPGNAEQFTLALELCN